MALMYKICFSLLFMIISIAAPPSSLAGTSNKKVSSESAILDFACLLYKEKDYHRASSEAKRFLFFHPNHTRTGEAKALLKSCMEKINSNSACSKSFTPWSSGVCISRGGNSHDHKDSAKGGILTGLVKFYQDHLRTFKSRHSSCPSYPNCSNYAIQAINKHGALLGSFIYVDRFWREATTAGKPPFVSQKGRMLHYDPLELNDYWLKRAKEAP